MLAVSPHRSQCERFLIVFLVTLCCVILLLLGGRSGSARHNFTSLRELTLGKTEQIDVTNRTWTDLAVCLREAAPKVDPPKHLEIVADWKGEVGRPTFRAGMSYNDIVSMRLSHKRYQECIAPLSLQSTYTKRSRGIVTTAGGRYIGLMLVSLRMLRKTGSIVPVEVFLATRTEYDTSLCEIILPSLGGKCRILSEEVGSLLSYTNVTTYQLKILSILASSFEDVVFIDADNLALTDPSAHFDSRVYRENGLILWPDFWLESRSSIFASIQNQPLSTRRMPIQTCESGQILVSKRRSEKTLFLATMYNIYGPDYYYPLLSQGAPGEGDKETFAAAANMYLSKEPFYVVQKRVEPIGSYDDIMGNTSDFHGRAMMQFHPGDDYNAIQEDLIRPAFIHANFPKLDPFHLLDEIKTSHLGYRRMWGDLQQKFNTRIWRGSDTESQVWQEMINVACNDATMLGTSIAGNSSTCAPLKAHREALLKQSV